MVGLFRIWITAESAESIEKTRESLRGIDFDLPGCVSALARDNHNILSKEAKAVLALWELAWKFPYLDVLRVLRTRNTSKYGVHHGNSQRPITTQYTSDSYFAIMIAYLWGSP